MRELKLQKLVLKTPVLSRTPPGVRELKLDMLGYGFEITISRTPPGVRELKLSLSIIILMISSRTPPGVRELKPPGAPDADSAELSHPSRGAGIETLDATDADVQRLVAPLPGCVN